MGGNFFVYMGIKKAVSKMVNVSFEYAVDQHIIICHFQKNK